MKGEGFRVKVLDLGKWGGWGLARIVTKSLERLKAIFSCHKRATNGPETSGPFVALKKSF